MSQYVLSFRFESEEDVVAERFGGDASMLLKKLRDESYEGVDNLQVAIVRLEEPVATE